MPGVRSLANTQLGRESTGGTPVAATTIWRGPVAFPEDMTEPEFAKEDVAIIGGTDRTYIPKSEGKIAFPSTEATFEQLGYILNAGVKYVASGVADGGGSGYVYDHPLSLTSVNTIAPYTIEAFDDQQEEEASFCYVTDFELTGEAQNAWMMAANWHTHQPSASTKTAALSLPSVSEILFQQTKLYIDAVSGSIGTTQITETFLAASLKVTTGYTGYWTGDGDLDFTDVKMGEEMGFEIEGTVTFEHDGSAVAQKAAWRAQTAQLMRIETLGPALDTAGTSHTYKTMRLDLPFKWKKFGIIESRNGNDVVTGTFWSRYNLTAALGPSILLVNELSALP